MKKALLIPAAVLAIAWACGDSARSPVAPGTQGTPLAPTPGGITKDDIANDLDASVDAAAEAMPLNVGGASGTTSLFVTPRNGDGKNGCNLTGGTTLKVAVSSNNTAVATVSLSNDTFTSCSDTKTLTVTPVAQGTATISISVVSNSTDGSFNLAPGTFTVNVAPPANTAPTVSVAGVTGGATYNKGSVPAATCQVTDAEDGNSSFAATLSVITGIYSSDGIGSQTASCAYTDDGGLTASTSETYSIIDGSVPTIGYTLNPTTPDGTNQWYKSDVTLKWNVADADSPNSLQKTGCADQNITSDQTEQTYSCAATSAGGSAGPTEVSIKRDATAPTASATASATPAKNANGWYSSTVTVDFDGSDATSEIATCTGDAVLSGEGANQSASGTCTDNAGNVSAQATASGINIDLTDPNVTLVGGPADGASYYYGFVPAAPTCNANDALSGLDGACGVTGYGTILGSHEVTASAKDLAGNTASDSHTYTVLAWTMKGFYQPVDMGEVFNTVKAGSTVPLKFEIFAGSTELTNTASVQSFVQSKIACDGTAPVDDIEFTTTGGTSLRYDATAGQFVQNWQTPKLPGACYRVTMTANDGSKLIANFKLK
jgi:hypothetical protein